MLVFPPISGAELVASRGELGQILCWNLISVDKDAHDLVVLGEGLRFWVEPSEEAGVDSPLSTSQLTGVTRKRHR